MAADPPQVSDGLYMTEEQYLALDEATDGNYEFYDGYVVMLRPPSSAYDERAMFDMAGAVWPTRPCACAWEACSIKPLRTVPAWRTAATSS